MTRQIHTPGAAPEEADDQDGAPTKGAKTPSIKDLMAQLAARDAQIAALTTPATPGAIYTPITPKGAAAMAASSCAHLSVSELMAKIDAGEVREPVTGLLCADGWYAGRVSRDSQR